MSPAVSCTLRLPVEAKDVDGKKGEKGKKKFCYTRDLSATGPLLGNLGLLPLCGRWYSDSGSITPDF